MDKWELIRAEYEAGGVSVRDLAEKHGIGKTSIADHAKAGGWKKGTKKADKAGRKRTKKADKNDEDAKGRRRPRERDPCGVEEHDWEKIKSEYIQGISPTEIAEKYGVDRKRIYEHAKRGGWMALRDKTQIIADAILTEKAAEKIADDLELNMRTGNALMLLVSRMADRFSRLADQLDDEDGVPAKALMSLASAYGTVNTAQMSRAKHKLDSKRLDAELKKAEDAVDQEIRVVMELPEGVDFG